MRCITFCLSLALTIGGIYCAFAQTDVHNSKIVSGPGGGPFDDACHPGDVLVGFNYISGSAMNRLAGVCQAQKNGVLVGANYGLNTQGEDPGNGTLLGGAEFHAQAFPRCPPGQAINEMRVWLDRFGKVNKVAASCTPLLADPHVQPVYLGEFGGGGEPVSSEPITCGPVDIAIGMIGRSGSLIDGVGLKCGTFPWRPVVSASSPPVVTPPVAPPAMTPPQVKVIAAVDIYDMPDPLPGDKPKPSGPLDPNNTPTVTLLATNPDHYYQLSWPGCPPQPNWVYSGPPGYVSLDPTTLAAAEAALGGGH